MAQISALPSVPSNYNSGWLVNKNGHIFLALQPQIPLVRKICWKNDKSALDWLKRVSTINSGIRASSAESTHFLNQLVNKQGDSEKQGSFDESIDTLKEQSVKQNNEAEESCLLREPISHNLQIPDGFQSRKPDSAYIGSISRIDANVAICFSEISKKSYNHETLTASLFQPKNGKFTTEFFREGDLSPQRVFFSSEVTLRAKRKLSFEYIQEVSMLQYGHNSVENGNFRRWSVWL